MNSKEYLNKALSFFDNGQLVAIPTETVYGLSAPINNEKLIKLIFELKQRPLFDPLIVHVSSIEMAKRHALKWSETEEILAQKFWPGPLTIIVPKKDINPLITSSRESVGLRMPNHPLTLELIDFLNIPLVAPSANKFKKTSPTTARHVKDEFGEKVFIIDGGSSPIGIESTVLEVKDNEVLIYRPGMITKDQICKELASNGISLNVNYASSPVAPGQMQEHYRPQKPLILMNKNTEPSFITSELKLSTNWEEVENIDLGTEPHLAARELYGHLQNLSKSSKTYGLIDFKGDLSNQHWHAIYDRLAKATKYNFIKDIL